MWDFLELPTVGAKTLWFVIGFIVGGIFTFLALVAIALLIPEVA